MSRHEYMRMILAVILSGTLFSSCFSYRIFPREDSKFVYEGAKKKAYVQNPALKKEYKILKRASIFELTDDSLDQAAVKIRLHPLTKRFSCGEPLLGSLITLGQVPVYLPDRYQYAFDEWQGSASTPRQFELHIATRYWFWDMFNFKKGFDKKAGQALLADYYHH